MRKMKIFEVTALWVLVLGLCSFPSFAQVSGAIFTTDSNGTTVNGNIYDNAGDVYLNGGPQNGNCNAAGLPDGDYYFQVTDPSGVQLLSTDDIAQRRVTVSGGVITAYDGITHSTGTGPCGGVTVELYSFCATNNSGGEYKVWMTPVESYDVSDSAPVFGFYQSMSKTDNFKLRNTNTTTCFTPPPPPPNITGFKFYDANTNGLFDSGEVKIPGWRINALDPLGQLFFTYTDSTGAYLIPAEPDVTYAVSEVLPNVTWIATGCIGSTGVTSCSSNTSASVIVPHTGTVPGPKFGNVCVGPAAGTGGKTLGFWSNKNGQALITSSDLAFLSSLNLVNANGSAFDPTTAAGLKTWLLSATATNMAYMLSAQLATMELNVSHGFVDPSSLIYAPGTSSANAAGFATVGAIMTEANNLLGSAGGNLTLAGSALRAPEEAVKNALDRANNNLNFVEPGPSSCPFTTPY